MCALLVVATVGDAAPTSRPAEAGASTAGPATRTIRRRVMLLPATQRANNPLPGISAQQAAEQRIRAIYASDYADTSFNGRRSLARRLIAASNETKRDSDAKFVLLREARDLAAAVGDVPTALEAIDQIALSFPVNKLVERVEMMKSAMPALQSPQANLAGVSICMDLVDQCVVEADYPRADTLIQLASDGSKRARSVPYFQWVEKRAAAIRPLKQAYEFARPAEITLGASPNDPQANLVMGRFVAFVKGDFDAGLTMIARGADPVLAKLADDDLNNPEDSRGQFKLATAWWDLGETQPGEFRAAMQRRAGFWYQRAMPKLDGLDRAMAERRLQALNPPAKPGTSIEHPPDALRLTGNHWYRASVAEVSWETAQRICQTNGAQLVCIETRVEGELMAKLARGRALWLGASVDPTGRWNWITGGNFFYTNWDINEPADTTSEYHPLTGPTGAWRTSNGRAGFICEWSE